MKYPDEMLKGGYIILMRLTKVATYYHRWRDSVFDLFRFVHIDHELSILLIF